MKTCLLCHVDTEDKNVTCPKCGEGTFSADDPSSVDTERVPRQTGGVAPVDADAFDGATPAGHSKLPVKKRQRGKKTS